MDYKYSPEAHLMQLTQSWIGTILIIGAILFPVLEFMDYFISPDKFLRFMMYRLIISVILISLYYLNKLKRNKAYQYSIAAIGTAMCAITIEAAILQSGGQSSIYYAAMIILAICSLGFVPFSLPVSFSLVGIIYGIYVVPIALTERITAGPFVSNNVFLISTFVIGLLLRYNNQKLITTELKLRQELSLDKDKLERYSHTLKEQIDEKTGALAISEQRYRQLFENATDSIAVLDQAGTIMEVNQQFCALHGFDRTAILGTNIRLLEVESLRGEIEARLERILNGETLRYETEHLRKDGSRVLLEISARAIEIGGVVHIQTFLRDIQEKKLLQEQVMQSQKMESMGALAGGIAHDFNNTLTAILGHAEVLRRRIITDDFGQRRIKTIEDAARRAGHMVSKLLSFARKETLALAPIDLNSVVKDTVELLGRALIDRSITLKVTSEHGLPAINGDSIHLEQIITNLVMNAMDAMPNGGSLSITTSSIRKRHDARQAQAPFLAPGAYVVLTISDSGTGIPREILDRIFDPFFTTKPVGKGTGLGLAMVYGLVKSHKGEVRVRSDKGEGTTFDIFLPALDESVRPETQPALDALPGPTGKERILVVDDEKDVLSYLRDILDAHGYQVFATDDPVYAQELFRSMSGQIDLVITDMVMPLMNGAELSAQFKNIKPTLKVIGITGFTEGSMVSEARHIDIFMKKPFDSHTLLSAVRQVLDSPESGAELPGAVS